MFILHETINRSIWEKSNIDLGKEGFLLFILVVVVQCLLLNLYSLVFFVKDFAILIWLNFFQKLN